MTHLSEDTVSSRFRFVQNINYLTVSVSHRHTATHTMAAGRRRPRGCPARTAISPPSKPPPSSYTFHPSIHPFNLVLLVLHVLFTLSSFVPPAGTVVVGRRFAASSTTTATQPAPAAQHKPWPSAYRRFCSPPPPPSLALCSIRWDCGRRPQYRTLPSSTRPLKAAAAPDDGGPEDDDRGVVTNSGVYGGGITDTYGNATASTMVAASAVAEAVVTATTRPRAKNGKGILTTTTTVNGDEASPFPNGAWPESSSSSSSSSPSPPALGFGGETGTSTPRVGAIPTASLVLLNGVAVLWGTQHAVVKSIVDGAASSSAGGIAAVEFDVGVDPAFFTLARFLLAAAVATVGNYAAARVVSGSTSSSNKSKGGLLLVEDAQGAPSLPARTATPFPSTTLRWGLEMGLYMFLGFAFQAIGLQSTTASKSGFLLYLNVKFVPLLAYLLLGRQLTVSTVLSAVAAFAGTALLATNGQISFGTTNLNVGDAWSVLAAMASAMFILRLERASAEAPNAAALNAASLWTVTLLSFVWWTSNHAGSWNLLNDMVREASGLLQAHLPELLYLSVVATALTNWIQTVAQRDVPAERASIIYAMDPVYGAMFAHLWLGENLDGTAAWIGASIIVVAAATNALLDLPGAAAATSPPEKSDDTQ
jgi:drug/metabolite transporter (DMT)-like permease